MWPPSGATREKTHAVLRHQHAADTNDARTQPNSEYESKTHVKNYTPFTLSSKCTAL